MRNAAPGRRFIARPLRLVAAGALLASALSLVAAGTAGAAKKSPLGQGLAFYRGKTISFVVGSAPGGSLDGVARLIAPYMASYLQATINVEDVNVSTAGQNDVAAAQPNCLTIGLLNAAPDAIANVTHTPGVNFNPAHVDFIGAPGANSDMFITAPSASISSFASLIHSPTPVRELSLTSGYDPTLQLLVNAAFGIKAQILTGYPNEAGLVQGFVRGDGQLMFGPVSSTAPLVSAGKGAPIGISKAVANGSSFQSQLTTVPTFAQLAKQYPPKTRAEKAAMSTLLTFVPAGAQIVFTPTRTPASCVDALIAAMHSAVRNPAEIHQALLENLTPGWQSGPTMKQTYLTMLRDAKPLASLFASE